MFYPKINIFSWKIEHCPRSTYYKINLQLLPLLFNPSLLIKNKVIINPASGFKLHPLKLSYQLFIYLHWSHMCHLHSETQQILKWLNSCDTFQSVTVSCFIFSFFFFRNNSQLFIYLFTAIIKRFLNHSNIVFKFSCKYTYFSFKKITKFNRQIPSWCY